MTILEALKSGVNYPLSSNTFIRIATQRGIVTIDEFTTEVANSNSFKGALADLLYELITVPNISEGGMSISFSEKKFILDRANSLYLEIGEQTKGQPKVQIQPF